MTTFDKLRMIAFDPQFSNKGDFAHDENIRRGELA